MRVTPGMITSQYNRNLNKSLSQLNYYNNRATTLRKFNRASEDPVSAARAYSLRRSFAQNDDFTSNLEDTENLLLTAQGCVMSMNKLAQEISSTDCLQAINGTMSVDDRQIIATKIRKMQEALVSTANSKFGDKFMFGGSTSTEPPFTVKDGNLLYKGYDVTTGLHVGADGISAKTTVANSEISFGAENGALFNDYTININEKSIPPIATEINSIKTDKKVIDIYLSSPATKQNIQDALHGLTAPVVAPPASDPLAGVDFNKITVGGDLTLEAKFGTSEISGGKNKIATGSGGPDVLKALANEKMFVDLGLGLNFGADGKINEQSAFDASMPGISFIGYGKDSNGNPKNMYALLGKIADELSKDNLDYSAIDPLITGFNAQKQTLLTKITEFGSKSNFLDYTKTKLEDTHQNLNAKILSVEYVNPAEAIMDFKMQEYAYNAALQMGTKIIQPSFLDFMR